MAEKVRIALSNATDNNINQSENINKQMEASIVDNSDKNTEISDK
jgi:hypothetical protein